MSNILSFGKSDVGLRRSNNEDALVLRPDMGFVAVSDGMGGSASGEVASRIFIQTAVDVFSVNRVPPEDHTLSLDETIVSHPPAYSEQRVLELVENVFQLSNENIFKTAEADPNHSGMGCTAELVAFYDQSYIVGHVGDSRTYLFRQGELTQITRDHSVVQNQLDQGLITQADARNHSLRHVILRAVGIRETLSVDLIRGKTLPGDIVLLCSDGLTDMIEDSSIRDVLMQSLDLNQKIDRLIELAKAAGGNDNITVALCEVVSP